MCQRSQRKTYSILGGRWRSVPVKDSKGHDTKFRIWTKTNEKKMSIFITDKSKILETA